MSTYRVLPSRPSLSHLKKQAKQLLNAHKAHDREVVPRLKGSLPKLANASDDAVLSARFSLLDAQFVIAREYGFDSWDALAAQVENVLMESPLPDLIYRGKVRDTHDRGDGAYLMVATDRISVFDVVLPTGIPEKGAVLSQISRFWFAKTGHIIPNHFISMGSEADVSGDLGRRSMIVKKADRVDVECIVRGYITGSAWSEYRKTGTVQGNKIQEGLVEGDKFPEPLFTPTTKAEEGHDENMSFQEVVDMVGEETAGRLRDLSIEVYNYANDFALERGIILADTKMEFGFVDGELSLIDELLTPDSSRFWDTNGYAPGKSQPNYNKQFVRDWVDSQGWDHEPPAPELPGDIVRRTTERYLEAYKRLTGEELS